MAANRLRQPGSGTAVLSCALGAWLAVALLGAESAAQNPGIGAESVAQIPGGEPQPSTSTWLQETPQPNVAGADPDDEPWFWQLTPDGLIYRSYLAGMREPRLAGVWEYDRKFGWMLDAAVGGRVGLVRYGTANSLRPEGWELDFEGAAFPRLQPNHEKDLVAADFRYGVPLTYGFGPFTTKFAFYHLSSHLGDEYMLHHSDVERINYVRDALVWGAAYYLGDDIRVYADIDWAFDTDGGAQPWHYQFGIEYCPLEPIHTFRGAPFVAINTEMREEVDFGGNFVVQAGWRWRGASGHMARFGVQYFQGKSDQFEFYRSTEEKVGLGLWYDF